MTDVIYYDYAYDDYDPHIRARYGRMHDELQEWEEVQCEDAELLLVAYGISSRVCKEALKIGRGEGLKIGLLRPITLWPFPEKAMEKYNGRIKGLPHRGNERLRPDGRGRGAPPPPAQRSIPTPPGARWPTARSWSLWHAISSTAK